MFQNYISKRRAFWQLYPVLFAFICIPVASLTFLFYSHSTAKLNEEYNKNNMNLLLQAKAAVDVIIDTIFYNSNQLYDDKRFLTLIRQMEEQPNPLIRGQLLRELERIKGGSKHVESVVLYLDRDRSVLSTDYGFVLLNDYPDQQFIADSLKGSDDLGLISRKIKLTNGYERSGQQVETLMKRIPYTATNEAIFYVNLNVNQIYEDIIKKLESPNGSELYAVDEGGNLLLYGSSARILPELLKHNPNNPFGLKKDRQEQFGVIELGKNQYAVVSVYSDYLRARFVWVSPMAYLNSVFTSIRSLSILNSLAVLFILCFLALWTARRLSKPIDELFRSVKVVDTSRQGKRGDVYSEISRIVNETLMSNDALRQKLARMLPLYRGNYLHSVLTQKGLDEADIHKGMEEYGIQLVNDFVYIVTLELIHADELWQRENNVSVYLFALDQLMEEVLYEYNFHAYKVNLYNRRFALLLNMPVSDPAECKSRISRLLKKLLMRAFEELQIEMAAGVSRSGSSFSELHTQYQESIKAIQYRMIEDIAPIIFADEVNVSGQRADTLLFSLEEKLELYITMSDEDKVESTLTEVFGTIRSASGLTAEAFREQMLFLMSIMMKLAERLRVDVRKELLPDTNLLDKVTGLRTVSEAESFVRQVIHSICKETAKRRNDLEHIHLIKIIDYIDTHYHEDLSIDRLSEKVNISPSYIFKILRQQKQTTFIEYITHLRMEKACELLRSNMQVQEIAQSLGFSTSRYFIQVFKKIKGVTPNEYRKLQDSHVE